MTAPLRTLSQRDDDVSFGHKLCIDDTQRAYRRYPAMEMFALRELAHEGLCQDTLRNVYDFYHWVKRAFYSRNWFNVNYYELAQIRKTFLRGIYEGRSGIPRRILL